MLWLLMKKVIPGTDVVAVEVVNIIDDVVFCPVVFIKLKEESSGTDLGACVRELKILCKDFSKTLFRFCWNTVVPENTYIFK